MGKVEEEQHLPISVIGEAQRADQNAGNDNGRGCCIFKKFVSFRCVFALLFGVAVLLSAIFWLPIFHYGDQKDLDLDSEYAGHAIVASFMVNKPASFLEDFSLQLEDDIFDEMRFISTKVELLSLESSEGSNRTKVVFAVESDTTTRSLIRDTFVSILIHQYSLRLTASLFGEPFSFEVLKFLGGITVSPQQSAFLMQKVHLNFNFTLNFSIQQLQNNFDALREQLKSGIHLAPYENLYISFTNLRGSTVAPPSIVQCQVLMAVGINASMSRIKELAQTIKDSHAKNLGLNNTVFGRVKQVRLSSILQHSLGGNGAPSPAPMPHLHHHHHHHHHHGHHHESNFVPAVAPSPRTDNGGVAGKGSAPRLLVPTPAPTQRMSHKAKPPGCHFRDKNRYPRNGNQHSHLTPISPPALPPNIAPSPKHQTHPAVPTMHNVPAASPLPSVAFARVRPPSERGFNAEPPDLPPSISPSPSSSSAVITLSDLWSLLLILFLALHW
ncbi:hypothetical protein M9H77_28472 [Catharanthus roseus]|uniref:Uncharacterized protein n=1 Tax=Catharanthus roseus TaxID=4058 RepID=A0ACC0AFU2_CATRO|nr:hypothetical protein M9H77_28472 [Catharanthus roseus]